MESATSNLGTSRPSAKLEVNREAVRALPARYHFANPRLFGSALRGEDREGSDLDFLVDAMPGATLFSLAGLIDDLENLLGVKVDVKTPDSLPDCWREEVMQEAQPV